MTATTGRSTAETMAETEITNNNQDTNRETKTTQTGMTIIKIEMGTTITKTDTGSTTEGFILDCFYFTFPWCQLWYWEVASVFD